ncbi:acetyl/propionyl-CoA carboxylase alpha subunit/acetyl-CoA carboxylase carboxyltransferase component [Friedmanniella endophytica]|uniref:biotin carboxylase n=1 Tax=Microlunatus kandeliicorticis TaxID=1759536 RepID=A0A7W3P424_9ACTN|nr:carboxyl transferase domain-containing protein [Microlunatus kandeliicorticis]MBA8792464.1 acetyl/propionyl-CoA carboxylase alpha subunit/acetyl-CoA carboxylase carboxyltransferase component [Microlunatus kandeliicorticis]
MPKSSRIVIVNRGEAAMRLIHAVRDLNARRSLDGGEPLRTVALYTDVDAGAAFVREADETYLLGNAADRPYLDLSRLETALRETAADAVWVGWGFVAEDPNFADLCARLGVTFIGPSAEAMRRLGDKIGSKLIAEEAGVPIAPWSRGPVDTLEQALEVAERIGYPLMLKATAGGGGRGIRRVDRPEDLVDAYQRTRDEAARAFGSGIVFIEKLITGARHVEVQVIADGQGTAWAVGVRDCSVQRRNQKVIEESASALLEPAQSDELKAAAERLALAVGYAGAGTVEFLYHPETRSFAFLEVNTRLQVEHPVTELVTGLDLVALQLQVADGIPLTGDRPVERGHAIEARLNAEDPDRGFAPAPGRIARLEFPAGPGVRVDTGVAEGDTIPADFDSMIAKIIAYGATRDEALARLRRAMLETNVVIAGGATNKSFVLTLLDRPEVTRGEPAWADTGWIDRTVAAGGLVADAHAGAALVAAAIETYAETERDEISHFLATARGGRPQLSHETERRIELELRGTGYRMTVGRISAAQYRVAIDDPDAPDGVHTVLARLERIDDVHARLVIGRDRYRLVLATHGTTRLVEVNGVAHRISRDEGGVMRAPTPALVVGTPVAVGTEVEAGQPVLVLESMKMETVLAAPVSGRLVELLVRAGTQVGSGEPLARVEPIGEAAAADAPTPPPIELPTDPTAELDAAGRARLALSALRDLLLGWDISPTRGAAVLRSYLENRDALAATGVDVLAEETALIELFTDVADLTRNRPADEELHTELRVHSPREYFHTYLGTLDLDRAGLPEHFREKLLRVLAHYDVTELEPGPALDEALFRIFLVQQRNDDVDVVIGLLQRWLTLPAPSAAVARSARTVLERLVRVTQRRFPVIGDLARSVRFGWFDQRQVDEERQQVLAGVAEEVAALVDPDAPDRDVRIEALTAIPEQLIGFLNDRLAAGIGGREPLLEVLIRRHYLEYDLHDLVCTEDGGRPLVRAEYVSGEHGPTRVVSTVGAIDELGAGGALGEAVSAALAPDHDTVVEVYLRWPDDPAGRGPSTDPDALSAQLIELLAGQSWVTAARRVTVAVCPGGDRSVAYFTFRPDGDELVEDALVRDMHPMVGRRLNLWRLREFDVTRLQAPANVQLYECVARSNPSDRRLVAAAQVRQMAVVRDDEGRVVALPHAERAVENCLEAIRRVRTQRGSAGSQLEMNHVWVTVWPAIEADLGELTALQDKITPLSDGTGIEEVLAQGRVADAEGVVHPIAIRFRARPDGGTAADVIAPPSEPLAPLDDYAAKVARSRRRGLVYPYELASALTRGGSLVEHDLDDSGRLVPVDRPRGRNSAGIIVAVVTTPTPLYPDGITRVVLCGDPTKALGALSEAECSRIVAALDLAEEMGVPVEWYAVSAGARVSMSSGTENMDWVAAALKRIVEFTQAGHEINIVVAGINVGAQPYWNAEATMLMHTKGILVMTPDSAMVLTGKQTLDFAGSVSAEDNFGIGGYDRVMGPNGQAQYWAPDLAGALDIVLAHYEHTYVAPGESGPRRAETSDPVDRDVSDTPHPSGEFSTVGEIFSSTHNPDRKRAFDIRTVMRAVTDADHPMHERWAGMADAETAVVVDARVGGHAVCLIGIESKPVPRAGFPPTDGPDAYTAGTLFPRSSKKVARAINAASGNRPVVVLANLSGFDGSPESMRNLQLEYGAEIGRAMVNFDGPIVFVVISRYHGGAFVVFSKRLNPQLTVLAVEGSYASVLGGAPAAAVVFASEVAKRAAADPRIRELEGRIGDSPADRRGPLSLELSELRAQLRAEKINELAAEFDAVHNIHRAVEVGSVDEVIKAAELRPKIIEAIGKGLAGR